jgi:ankyrin repeat protein
MDMPDDTLKADQPDETFAAKAKDLLRAAAEGDASQVAAMLQADPGLVNAKGPHPYWGGEPCALHVAAEWGHADVVRELLERGADPDGRNGSYGGWSPLHCAIHRGHGPARYGEIITLLMARGAQVDIWAASAMGDSNRVQDLLSADPAQVHARGPNSATPLHFASTAEVASLLLQAGADLAVQDTYGRTPVQFIACFGAKRRAAAEHVLKQTGDRDVFVYCALGDMSKVSESLNADPALAGLRRNDHGGKTLLHVASEHGHVEIVTLLLERGAEIMGRADGGLTALHLAAGNGHRRVAELLLENGAELNALDTYHNSTPLGWAEFQGHRETAAYLRNRGGYR